MPHLHFAIVVALFSVVSVFGQEGSHGHHHGEIQSSAKWEKEQTPDNPTLIFYKLPRCGICVQIDNWLTPLHDQDKTAANFILKTSTLPENQPAMEGYGIEHHGIVILGKDDEILWTAQAHGLRHDVLAEAYAKYILTGEEEPEPVAEDTGERM